MAVIKHLINKQIFQICVYNPGSTPTQTPQIYIQSHIIFLLQCSWYLFSISLTSWSNLSPISSDQASTLSLNFFQIEKRSSYEVHGTSCIRCRQIPYHILHQLLIAFSSVVSQKALVNCCETVTYCCLNPSEIIG